MYIDNAIPLVPYPSVVPVPYISEDLIFDLWKTLYLSSNGPNFIFSPYCVISALMMLLLGSTGHTQLQLARALFGQGFNGFNGFNDTLLNQHVTQFDKWNREFLYHTRNMVQTGNFIYSQQEFKPNYTQTIAKLVKANATFVDFVNPKRTIERINWDMSRVTNGAVPNFLTNLEDNANLILINTVFLDSRWAVEFDPNYTNFSGQFWVSSNKSVKATMMAQHSMLTDEELEYSYGYYRNSKSGVEAVKMPYGKGQVSLVIILPPKNITIHSYVRDQFNAVAFNAICSNFRRSTFSPLIIPRLKLSLKHSLKSTLGITNLADFSGMFQQQGQSPVGGVVSEIMQGASIEFHESGAKTVGSKYSLDYLAFDAMDNPPPLEQFRANRPFLFAVVSEQSEKVKQFLFAGVVKDPTA